MSAGKLQGKGYHAFYPRLDLPGPSQTQSTVGMVLSISIPPPASRAIHNIWCQLSQETSMQHKSRRVLKTHLLVLGRGDFLQEVCDALALWQAESQALEEWQHLSNRSMEQYVTCADLRVIIISTCI